MSWDRSIYEAEMEMDGAYFKDERQPIDLLHNSQAAPKLEKKKREQQKSKLGRGGWY